MAFCKYCGKELPENTICNCREQSASAPMASGSDTMANTPARNSIPSASGFDFGKVTAFFTQYLRNPDKAVDSTVKGNDKSSIIVCLVLFIVSNVLAQLAIGINTHGYHALFMLFGLLAGCLGIILPATANTGTALLGKENISKKELLKRSILNTPFASFSLLLTFLIGLFGYRAFLICAMITAVVFAVSMGGDFIAVLNRQSPSLMKKGIAALTVSAYILIMLLLFSIELRAVAETVIANFQKLVTDILNLLI